MSEQREEIRRIVAGGGSLMTAAQIFEKAKGSDDRAAFSVMLSGMAKVGEIAKFPAPAAAGSGVKFVYGPQGSEPPTAPAAVAQSEESTSIRASKPRKQRGASKVQPKTAKKAAKTNVKKARTGHAPDASAIKAGVDSILRATANARRVAGLPANDSPAPPRWAFTSDGAFVLLGTSMEIPRPAASALVAFLHTLGKGDVDV